MMETGLGSNVAAIHRKWGRIAENEKDFEA
jgi:hypothetical protein